MKRQLLLLLTALLPLLASAYDAEIDGIYYNFSGNKATVTYQKYENYTYTSDYSGDVVIPSSVFYNGTTYSVTSIGAGAFCGCSSLTSITIPNSVTSIGNDAFYYCTSLTSVTIGNGVTSIGDWTFGNCSGLTSITIPNSVTSIGNNAFYNCSSLTSVTIGSGVTSIGNYAFYLCSSLTSVTIGSSVTSIGDYAFADCTSLTEVYCYAENVPSTYSNAFEDSPISSAILHVPAASVEAYSTTTPWSGFGTIVAIDDDSIIDFDDEIVEDLCVANWDTDGNRKLSKAEAADVETLGEVFREKTNITSFNELQYFTGLRSIGGYAFYGCSGLTSVTIPNSVTSIGEYAFYGCSGLTSVTIPNSVTSIGERAFDSTEKVFWLTNTPPSGYYNVSGKINYVSNNNFSGLSNVKVYPFLSSMFEVDGVKYIPVSPSERTCDAVDCAYNEAVENLNISSSVTYQGITLNVKKIMPSFAYNNTYIKALSVDSEDISEHAFYNCTGIKLVNMGEKVTEIAYSAFYGCSGLTSLTIPNSVTSIGYRAFYGCSGLTSVAIGNNVTSIGNDAFFGCDLTKVIAPDIAAWCGITFGNPYANPLYYSHSLYCDENTEVKDLVIPEGVTSIDDYAFYDCSGLTSVTIPNSVTSIGSDAFRNCSGLTSVTIPNSVTSIREWAFDGCSGLTSLTIDGGDIGNSAFCGCSGLTSVTIGNSVTSIGFGAFSDCSSLASINIPEGVTSIDDYVFQGCLEIKKVVVEDRETTLSLGSNGSNPLFSDCPLDEVYIGGKLSYNKTSSYGYSPFYRNTSLRKVTITDKETEISDNEFYGCTNLQDVIIGDGVTSIGKYAFSGCQSLKNFSFGTQVQTIGQEAFSDCTAMEKLTSKAQTPPTCGSQALDDINKWTCSLYVPDGTLAAYQAADQWKEFFFMQIDPDAIGEVKADENVAEVPRYDIQGRMIGKPQKGINIIRYSDGSSRKVLLK